MSARHAVDAEVRDYETLFLEEEPNPDGDGGLDAALNPDSLSVRTGAKLEPVLADASPGDRFQLERLGYYCIDPDSTSEALVLNRTATLRDTWAKMAKGSGQGSGQGSGPGAGKKGGAQPQGKKKNKQKKQKKEGA